MTATHLPISRTLKTLSVCVLLVALLKVDALSRYWQQQWRVALPLAGPLTEPTWLNAKWDSGFADIDAVVGSVNNRLTRAGQMLSAEPTQAEQLITPGPNPNAQCGFNAQENHTSVNLNVQRPSQPWPITLLPNDKVLLIGDSMMQGVAPYVRSALRKNYSAEAVDLSKHSTGLAYPGFFNWPDTIKEQLAKNKFKALVIFLGANDTWDIIHKGKSIAIGNEFWRNLYTERVETILTYAKAHSVPVIWLGAPPMGQEKMNKYVPALNQVYEQSTQKYKPLAIFAPTAKILTSDGVSFTKLLKKPDEGEVVVRANDGVHFTPAGQKIIARQVLNYFSAAN